MGQHVNIPTSRTRCIGGYMARPAGKPRGGIVVVQEIFGVTAHIRDMVDRYAGHGYTAIAPAFFDHLESGLELPYDKTGSLRGRQLVTELGYKLPLEDVASAAEAISSAGTIGCVGYCWGGTIALLAAQHLGMPAVSYYGARNLQFLNEPLKAPVQFHFGELDASIPPEAVAEHRQSLPDMEVYTYPANHAFNRDGTAPYDEPSARLAMQRSLEFFGRHLHGEA